MGSRPRRRRGAAHVSRALGRNVVIVSKGQPIPVGLDVNPDDVTVAPATSTRWAPDPAQLHRPEPDIGRQQRFSTRIERLMWLGSAAMTKGGRVNSVDLNRADRLPPPREKTAIEKVARASMFGPCADPGGDVTSAAR